MSVGERLAAAFRENFHIRAEIGASVSLWVDGEETLTLAGGATSRGGDAPWTAETLVPVFSATKGPAAATALCVLHQAGLTLAGRVADVWPAFGANGKSAITFADLLAHRSGLAALDRPVPVDDYDAVVGALAEQRPEFVPGTPHGYHTRTFGFLLDEIVRRLTGGQSLGDCWRERVAAPLGLEVWIGLPPSEDARVARLYPAPAGGVGGAAGEERFWRSMADPAALTRRAFGSPVGLASISSFNRPETWRLGLPAMGGVASARGLAKFYGQLAVGGGVSPPPVLGWMEEVASDGPDAVLQVATGYSAGFMKDPCDLAGEKLRRHFGPSHRAFGHPGAGGSLAFADPENRVGFAYVMNQLGRSPLPGERALALVRAVYSGDSVAASRRTR